MSRSLKELQKFTENTDLVLEHTPDFNNACYVTEKSFDVDETVLTYALGSARASRKVIAASSTEP